MRLALRKKGVKTSIKWSTEKLANKFVEVVLNKPVKHFEEEHYTEQNYDENFVSDAIAAGKDAVGIIRKIIEAIINFFKNLKHKKKTAEKDLTDVEKSIVDAADKGEKQEAEGKSEVDKDGIPHAAKEGGGMSLYLIIVGVAVVAYFALKGGKK